MAKYRKYSYKIIRFMEWRTFINKHLFVAILPSRFNICNWFSYYFNAWTVCRLKSIVMFLHLKNNHAKIMKCPVPIYIVLFCIALFQSWFFRLFGELCCRQSMHVCWLLHNDVHVTPCRADDADVLSSMRLIQKSCSLVNAYMYMMPQIITLCF